MRLDFAPFPKRSEECAGLHEEAYGAREAKNIVVSDKVFRATKGLMKSADEKSSGSRLANRIGDVG